MLNVSSTRRRRMRNGEGNVRGLPTPSRLGGLESVVSSPSRARGGTPAENDFTAFWA